MLSEILIVFAIKTVVTVVDTLPTALGRALSRGIVAGLYLFMPRIRAVALRNLQLAFPEKNEQDRSLIEQRSRVVLAENFYTFCKLPGLLDTQPPHLQGYDEFREQMRAARSRAGGKGVIISTLHNGCFELTVQYQCKHDKPVYILARGFGLPRVDRWWNGRRSQVGNQVFFRKGGYHTLVELLNQGKDVGVLFDQNVKANHATFVKLFGHDVSMTKSIALAALRTGAPVVFAAGVWMGGNQHRVYHRLIDTELKPGQDYEEKILDICQQLNDANEWVVRKHPEQWFWIHRRFKTRPPGQPENIYGSLKGETDSRRGSTF
jgi:KDO2-lipid IV(A) lauroyltransferase